MKIRKRLSPEEAKMLGFTPKPNDAGNRNARYYITPDQLKMVEDYRSFETVKRIVKDGDIVSETQRRRFPFMETVPNGFEVKRITTNIASGQQWVVAENKTGLLSIDRITEIIKGIEIPKIHSGLPIVSDSQTFDRLIISDVHIGMSTDDERTNKWDAHTIAERFDDVVGFVIRHAKSQALIIDDLGDFIDNYDGYTSRHHHTVPQPMTTAKAFEIALQTKINLTAKLLGHYSRVIWHVVVNDNHAGTLANVLAIATKEVLEKMFPDNVVFEIFDDFMGHYIIGEHAFILSHGKDKGVAISPLPPKLTPKANEIISGYITQNGLWNYNIEFSKGDSHQMMFDMGSSFRYDYCSYPKLAPTNKWSNINFGAGRSGVVMQNVDFDSNQKTIHYKFF